MFEHRNKYLLITLFCSVVLILFSFIPWDSDSDEVIVGYVSDLSETNNGYVFTFTEDNGELIHCFSKTRFELYQIYEISGSFSNDKSIFFVTSFTLCQTEYIRLL